MSKREENIYKKEVSKWEGEHIKKQDCIIQDKKVQIFSQDINSQRFDLVAKEWLISLKPQLKETSIVKYTNILNWYIFPEFQNQPITEITRNDITSFIKALLVFGGVKKNGLSPKTVTGITSILKNIFDYAFQEKGYAVVNARNISIKQNQKPMIILSRTEQKKLSQYLYDNLTPCYLGILLCLYTGLRLGEICALRWGDISFKEQYLHVHQSMQRIQQIENSEKKTKVVISTPKSDCSIRKIPIPDEIFNLLIILRKSDNAFVLTGLVQKYVEPRTMQNRFKAVLKKCGIPDVNFHALRHTFATRCVEVGFDIKCLSEILGHASVNITLNRYVHPSMELKQKNMNMLSELLILDK